MISGKWIATFQIKTEIKIKAEFKKKKKFVNYTSYFSSNWLQRYMDSSNYTHTEFGMWYSRILVPATSIIQSGDISAPAKSRAQLPFISMFFWGMEEAVINGSFSILFTILSPSQFQIVQFW